MTRDGTAEPYSRDQTLMHERGKEKKKFPVQLTTSRIGNHTVDAQSAESDDHTHTHAHTSKHVSVPLSTSPTLTPSSAFRRVDAR